MHGRPAASNRAPQTAGDCRLQAEDCRPKTLIPSICQRYPRTFAPLPPPIVLIPFFSIRKPIFEPILIPDVLLPSLVPACAHVQGTRYAGTHNGRACAERASADEREPARGTRPAGLAIRAKRWRLRRKEELPQSELPQSEPQSPQSPRCPRRCGARRVVGRAHRRPRGGDQIRHLERTGSQRNDGGRRVRRARGTL